MSYPITQPVKALIPGIVLLLLAMGVQASNLAAKNALCIRDTARLYRHTGIIRHERNGDIVIALPAGAEGRYRVRFFDDKEALLFEIRQIRDPLLIIEKYNFGHAGRFLYELYRDNGLVERASFQIGS
ncbi:hypothetical protein [Puia sp.]|jgi:hypothetical protein|uniref:hypothetical protein n=1 Tax=Puia sp. TaxID=2045100 RepID=UPI002F3F0DB7